MHKHTVHLCMHGGNCYILLRPDNEGGDNRQDKAELSTWKMKAEESTTIQTTPDDDATLPSSYNCLQHL